MKKAFTMSEALIVLGIIAVIATLSVLAVQNAKPDPEIIMFRKAYKTTADIVQNMYYDKELYENATTSMTSSSIDNSANLVPMYTLGFFDIGGDSHYKFAEAFITRLNPLSHSTENGSNGFAIYTAETADGIAWEIEDRFGIYETSGYQEDTYITVYLDGTDATSCTYDATSCARPNKFIFDITNSGMITPRVSADSTAAIDPIACSYLRFSKVNKYDKIPKSNNKNSCF